MAEFSLDGGKTRILTEQCFTEIKTKGRPRKKLNELGLKIVEQLASFMCTEEEIAGFLGVTVETLHNNSNETAFLECIKNGQKKGKASLRMNQFRLSKTNAAMAIWLGKQYLGQSDSFDAGNENDKESTIKQHEELKAALQERIIEGLNDDEQDEV